jgi:APA family basic amino acid/polyamine antiporter
MKSGISTMQLFTLSFGAIVGVGWITVLGAWLSGAGSLGAAIAFVLGAAIMLFIGLCYADLAAHHPGGGGEMLYATATFGPGAGFAAGWLLILAYGTLIAFEAVAAGWIAVMIFPQLAGARLYESLGVGVHLGELVVALLGIVVVGYLNFRGTQAAARFQDALTWLLIATSIFFVVAGLINGDPANFHPLWASDASGTAVAGIAAVLITTPFWFAGFNVLPQALANKSDRVGPQAIRLAIVTSILAAGVFYVAIIAAGAAILPRDELLQLPMPAAGAFEAAFGSPLMGKVVLGVGFLGLITTWNAVFLAVTQLLHSMARQLRVFRGFGADHPRFGTPARAILCVSLASTALIGLGRGVLLPVVNLVGICFAIMFLVVSYAVVRRRRRLSGASWRRLRVPLIAVAVSLGILVLSLDASDGVGLPVSWWILLAWAAAGALVWSWAQRGRHS